MCVCFFISIKFISYFLFPAILNSKSTEAIYQMDKVLLHLESKEFTVEPPILQSLQHLTQWVADCAIYLLATLPHQSQNHLRFPGVSAIEMKLLSFLRWQNIETELLSNRKVFYWNQFYWIKVDPLLVVFNPDNL